MITSVVPLCLRSKTAAFDAGNGASRRALADNCPSSALLPGGGAICRHCGDFQPVIAALFRAGGQKPVPFTGFQHGIIIFRSKPVVKGENPGSLGGMAVGRAALCPPKPRKAGGRLPYGTNLSGERWCAPHQILQPGSEASRRRRSVPTPGDRSPVPDGCRNSRSSG